MHFFPALYQRLNQFSPRQIFAKKSVVLLVGDGFTNPGIPEFYTDAYSVLLCNHVSYALVLSPYLNFITYKANLVR